MNNEFLHNDNIQEIQTQIQKLEEEKNGRFIKLPFQVEIKHANKRQLLYSSVTDCVSYDEFVRMIYGFKIILKNPRYDIEKSSDEIVQIKSQMGDWWALTDFIATTSFNNFKTILNMHNEVLEKREEYKNQIKKLKENLDLLSTEESEKE